MATKSWVQSIQNLFLKITFWLSECMPWNAGCCPKMTVTNSVDPELNGEYLLQGEEEEKPEEICVDGCVYTMGGDEYCFILTNQGSVECQVWILKSGSPTKSGLSLDNRYVCLGNDSIFFCCWIKAGLSVSIQFPLNHATGTSESIKSWKLEIFGIFGSTIIGKGSRENTQSECQPSNP